MSSLTKRAALTIAVYQPNVASSKQQAVLDAFAEPARYLIGTTQPGGHFAQCCTKTSDQDSTTNLAFSVFTLDGRTVRFTVELCTSRYRPDHSELVAAVVEAVEPVLDAIAQQYGSHKLSAVQLEEWKSNAIRSLYAQHGVELPMLELNEYQA